MDNTENTESDSDVAPVRERGLKLCSVIALILLLSSRSRKGAWIEIALRRWRNFGHMVAPVRERGLKFLGFQPFAIDNSVAPVRERGLKFVGIFAITLFLAVAPVRERGLKSADHSLHRDHLQSLP